MALDNEYAGTAQLDPATAPTTDTQTPNQPAAPAPQARTNPALDVEKELQKLRSEQGRISANARRAEENAEQLRQQNRTLQMRDMSDVERITFERDEAYGYANSERTLRQEGEAERAREAARLEDLREIAEESGVPFSALENAQSPQEARRIAFTHIKSTTPAAREAEQERTEANAVYLGSGAPSTPVSRKEQRFQDHMQKRNATAYILEFLNGE